VNIKVYFGLRGTHKMHKTVDGNDAVPHIAVPE
jgi:hypothetical protein